MDEIKTSWTNAEIRAIAEKANRKKELGLDATGPRVIHPIIPKEIAPQEANKTIPDDKSLDFFDLYKSFASSQTDAPMKFHEALAYGLLSCVVNKKAWIQFGGERLYPNLYILLAAKSSLNRKSWSIRIAQSFLKEAAIPLMRDFKIPDPSSYESFISELARIDRDAPLACGLLVIDELSGFLKRSRNKQHLAGFIEGLTSAYDQSSLYRRTGVKEKEKEIYRVDEPFLNIWAGCSIDWLNEHLSMSENTGGAFARYLWVYHDEPNMNPDPWPKKHDKLKRDIIIEKLARISSIFLDTELIFNENSKAFEVYGGWYKTFRLKTQNSKWDQNCERLTIIVVKIAMLQAIAEYEHNNPNTISPLKSLEITDDHIIEGIEIVHQVVKSFDKIVIGNSENEVKLNKVIAFIQQRKETTRREIMRKFDFLTLQDMFWMENVLAERELIEIIKNERKRVSYQWIGD